MPRARSIVPCAAAGALVLALAPALSAAAATVTWTQAGDAWWSTATWSTGVPVAGDTVVFDGGPRSTYDFGAVTFAGLDFRNSHQIANNGGPIGIGGGGIILAPGSTSSIETNISTVGSQTWTVPAGAGLSIPTWITTDGAGTLTLAVDGTLALSGNLDALGTGAVVQTGSGTVVRSGGAGGGIADGYRIAGGTFQLDGASIGGTALTVAGGTLAGSGDANALALGTGALSPGITAAPTGTLIVTAAALDGGSYRVSLDAATASGDYVMASGGAVTGTGTTLDVSVVGTPSAGDTWEIIGADATGTVDGAFRFLSPAGATLADGAEFVSNGSRWAVSYTTGVGGVVELEYLGAAPIVIPDPPAGPQATLPDAGIDTLSAVVGGLTGVLLIAAGVVALAARRRDRVAGAR